MLGILFIIYTIIQNFVTGGIFAKNRKKVVANNYNLFLYQCVV